MRDVAPYFDPKYPQQSVSRRVYLLTVSPWVLIGMFVVASVAMWLRKRSWTSVLHGSPLLAGVGAIAGLVGLGLAVVLGTPLAEALTEQAVQWSMYPIVRGSTQSFAVIALLVGVGSLVGELVIRGAFVDWLLERRLAPVPAVLLGGFGDALVTSGDVTARLGASMFGIAMGWMFVAAGRSALPAICANVAFSVGALALEALRVVG